MKIELRSICDSDKHFRTPIDEYLKRCSKTITITQLRPQKHGTQKQIIQKETKHIVTKLQKVSSDTAIHLMSPKGNQIDTTQRSSLLQPGSKHLFIIWGPYGLDESLLIPHIQNRLSLGAHTMPHGLAKLVLLEQVYRCQMIHSGRNYNY